MMDEMGEEDDVKWKEMGWMRRRSEKKKEEKENMPSLLSQCPKLPLLGSNQAHEQQRNE